ncbi:MAG: YceI family protein [Raineya sp.]|jgi:polyisoprenoid-binding protein YceI|nr:YceI family protein [Raineya sp.]
MANTVKWALDPAHSELQFKVKHLVISTVTGSFNVFNGELSAGENGFDGGAVSFQADVNSINTGNSQRDEHLRSADFFDAANFPQMAFEGTELKKIDEENYTLSGSLTIRGTTKPVTLQVAFGGVTKDPWGNTKAGFEVTGKLNRKDFGLAWNALTEAGGVVVSEEVKIIANVQFAKTA